MPIEEVDEELRDEVKFECEKLGEVVKCLVHTVPSEEMMRVFVEYQTLEEAEHAYLDFSIRDFAGKPIQVDFYSEELLGKR